MFGNKTDSRPSSFAAYNCYLFGLVESTYKVLRLCEAMHRNDDGRGWSKLPVEAFDKSCNADRDDATKEEEATVGAERMLLRFLLHRSQHVRSEAATCIVSLFDEGRTDIEQRRANIRTLLTVMERAIDVDVADYPVDNQEESRNRASTLLSVFTLVAVECDSLEVDAVTAMIISNKRKWMPPT